MLGFFIALALLVALAFGARRLWLRRRLAALMRALPGGTPARAVTVASFSEIDDYLRARRCPCGGRYELLGEDSRVHGSARLRLLRLECGVCERETEIYFDVTELFH